MERKITFMGVTTKMNNSVHRDKMVKDAEKGYLTPWGLWVGLRATWSNMTPAEKEEEYAQITL